MTGITERTENTLFEDVLRLRQILITRATGGGVDDNEFQRLRARVLSDLRTQGLTPSWLKSCFTIADFWTFIKSEFGSYAARTEFIRKNFSALLEKTENVTSNVTFSTVEESLLQVDDDKIVVYWTKAVSRLSNDPDGAITSAKSLLEAIAKLLLEKLNVPFEDDEKLPKLYGKLSKEMKLAPDQHAEQPIKQILQGCVSVVEGLSAVRNKLGDAHANPHKPMKPAKRHAEFAVHCAGAVALFLSRTWQERFSKIA